MTKQQQDVKTFMQTFGQATPTSPTVPDEKTRILRIKLLLEEVLELAEASGIKVVVGQDFLAGGVLTNLALAYIPHGEAELVGMADALADIDYVNQGAAVAYGLNLEPFQDEVHRSNMTKLWKSEELETAREAGYDIYLKQPNGYLVKNKDGKVVKSPSYSQADLKKVLEAQLNSAPAAL